MDVISSRAIDQFNKKFLSLHEHPDQNIIMDLTKHAELNITVSKAISEIIVARIIDPITIPPYKLPIFYLIDVILKKVAGPYYFHFSHHIVQVFIRTFNELGLEQKNKLAKLVGIWEERAHEYKELNKGTKELPPTWLEALRQMRSYLNSINFNTITNYNQPPIQQYQVPMHQQYQPPLAQPPPIFQQQQQQQQHISNKRSHGGELIGIPDPRSTTKYNQQVQSSRQNIQSTYQQQHLQQQSYQQYNQNQNYQQTSQNLESMILIEMKSLYRELGGNEDEMTLDELASVNPTLYSQMRTTAETKINATMRNSPINGNQYNEIQGPRLNGYICETPVTVYLSKSEELIKTLESCKMDSIPANISKKLSKQLNMLISKIHDQPILPPMILGPLPLEPSPAFIKLCESSRKDIIAPIKQKVIEFPKFTSNDVLARNENKLRLLLKKFNQDYPFVYHEDAVRFSSREKLAKHMDSCIARKEIERKALISGEMNHRQWYCNVSQWVSDFNALETKSNLIKSNTSEIVTKNNLLSQQNVPLPFDENFMRCPVSKESFERIFDDDEGEWMYKNAAKILVSEAADASVYKLGQPTIEPSIRYLIVHRQLVLDDWINCGRASSIQGAKERYEAMGASDDTFIKTLEKAAADDEDVFVMLII